MTIAIGVRRSIMMALALLTLAGTARAQSQAVNGTIEGTISDTSGGLLPGVTVTVRNTDTGTERVVVTDANGLYRAPLLPLGTYTVSAELPGFKKYEQTKIPLTAGSSAVINMKMEVGGISEVVSVQADAAVVDLGKVDVGRNLNEREIHNLPLVSRNPYNFALLQPGVSGSENSEFGVPRFSANGSLLRINYQMDGNTNTQKDRAGLRLMPMSEVAIGEVKVTTSGYAPEFGQTMGLVYNAITPSGTNKLRGDVSYRFRRTPFSAYPFFTTISPRTSENKPKDVVNTVTASSGGPIVQDRVHYYAGFERTYRDMTNTFNLTPELVAQVGQPAQPNTVPAYQSVRFFLGKVDAQLAQGHRLTARVNWFENNNPFNGGAGGTTTIERGFDYKDAMSSTAVQVVSNWGSNRLNELRTQYAQRHFARKSHGGPEGISVNISNAISFGHPTSDGEDFVQGITQILDNFTLIQGRHSFKAGFDFQYVHDTRAVPLTATYTFPTVAAYLAAKNGTSPFGYTSFAQVIGDPNFEMNSRLFSAFWQDDWRLGTNLKLLYGVRYDSYFYPQANASAPFAYSQEFRDHKNNWGPRLGVAWTLGEKKDQVVRASTGIMYDQPLLAVYENAIQQNGLPARTTFSLNGTSPCAPAFPNVLSNAPGTCLPAQNIFAPDPDLKLAYNVQNSAQYARGFGRSFNGSIGVVYNRGYNLPVITDVNLINPVGSLADGRGIYNTAINSGTRLDPRFNHISAVQSPGESTYKALLLTFGKRSASGVQWDLNYTLGKGIDTAPLAGATLSVQGDQPRSDPRDLARDKGPNALDTRHSFNGSIVAMSHFNHGPNPLRKLLSDNQVGIILQFNSGLPFTVTSNRDLNQDGNNNDRPLNIGRNSYYLPARWNVDARLSRFIPLGGSRRVEVLGEFKNIFNIVQVSSIRNGVNVDLAGNIIVPLTFGNVVSGLTSLPSDSSDFLRLNGYEQRKFQLGFKFAF
jgi:hypothetical protein